MDSGNSLALNRWKAIILTNVGALECSLYASLDLIDLAWIIDFYIIDWWKYILQSFIT